MVRHMSGNEPVAQSFSGLGAVTWNQLAAAVGALFMIIGSFGPWQTNPLTSYNGFDLSDGWITLCGGLVGMAAVIRNGRVLAFVVGAAGLVTTFIDWRRVSDYAANHTLDGATVIHVGWGLYIAGFGSALLLVRTLLSLRRS